jgi:hypothetical protein
MCWLYKAKLALIPQCIDLADVVPFAQSLSRFLPSQHYLCVFDCVINVNR